MDLMQRATNSEGRMKDERNQFAYQYSYYKTGVDLKIN